MAIIEARTLLRDQRLWLALTGLLLGLGFLVLPAVYALSGAVLLVLLALALARYQYVVYFTVFLLPLEKVCLLVPLDPRLDTLYIMKFFPYQIPLLAAALGFFLQRAVDRKPLIFTPLDPWLWLISAYLALSVFWSPDQTLALLLVCNVIFHLLLYHLVINTLSDEKALLNYLKVTMVGGVLCAIAILVSNDLDEILVLDLGRHIQLQLAFGEQANRPAGIGGADHVAGYAATAIFAFLGFMLLKKGWLKRAVWLSLATLCFCSVLYTVSRGGLIAVSAAFVLFLLLQVRLKPHLLKLSALYGVVSLLLIVLVAPGLIDRLLIGFGYTGQLVVANRQFTANEANTAAGGNVTGMGARISWWKNALKEMERNPWKYLTGLGLAGFSVYSVHQGYPSPETNNIILSFFFEGGLFGVMILAPVLYVILMNVFNSYAVSRDEWRVLLVTAMAMVTSDMGVRGMIDYDLFSYGAKFCFNQMALLMAVMVMITKGDPRASLRLGLARQAPAWSRLAPAGQKASGSAQHQRIAAVK